MSELAFPYRIDDRRRTATADGAAHVLHLVEQVLLTSPGDRVNRPSFGCGLDRLVFEAGGEQAAAAARFQVQAALQQWLGSRIRVEGVDVVADGGRLEVTVSYVVLRTGEPGRAHLVREAGP